jgi:hypothetical protein
MLHYTDQAQLLKKKLHKLCFKVIIKRNAFLQETFCNCSRHLPSVVQVTPSLASLLNSNVSASGMETVS